MDRLGLELADWITGGSDGGEQRAKLDAKDAEIERLTAELEEAKQHTTDIDAVAWRKRAEAAERKAEMLNAELDKLREYIEDLPSSVEHEVVRVPVATRRQKALEEALRQFAKDYPTSAAVGTIQEYARQIESGLGPSREAGSA